MQICQQCIKSMISQVKLHITLSRITSQILAPCQRRPYSACSLDVCLRSSGRKVQLSNEPRPRNWPVHHKHEEELKRGSFICMLSSGIFSPFISQTPECSFSLPDTLQQLDEPNQLRNAPPISFTVITSSTCLI